MWLLLLLPPAAIAAGQPYRIMEGEQSRQFEVALNEVALQVRGRRKVMDLGSVDSVVAAKNRVNAIRTATGQETQLVLYEVGRPRNIYTRRILTDRILLRPAPGADAAAIALAAGASNRGARSYAPQYLVLEVTSSGTSLEAVEYLRRRPDVISAEPMLARQRAKRLIPDDTFFTNQWHLVNSGQGGALAGADINVTNVWDTFRGTNVIIAIIDDGLQTTHPDLADHVDTQIDYDWNDDTPDDPSPDLGADSHGTACAGVAAAIGNNALGVSGVAPDATIVGLRLIAASVTDEDEADAMAHSNDLIFVKSNSWGPADDGWTLEGPGPLTAGAFQQGAMTGRAGKGVIYLWAGGNGRTEGDDANYDGYANSIYTIAIGAMADDGSSAYYSEPGACLVICAPSDGGMNGIATTDLVGADGYNDGEFVLDSPDADYTWTFGGTSAACPGAAGVTALLLNANPSLGWRDVQAILIRSAALTDQANSDWSTNSAGLHFNHDYGAGLVDAEAAVALAQTWTNLGTQASTSFTTNLSLEIPDGEVSGALVLLPLGNTNLIAEHVVVTTDIYHPIRGNLSLVLTSPSGMQSRLATPHGDTGDNYRGWSFMSVRHWGEQSHGMWRLRVADTKEGGNPGIVSNVQIRVYGTQTALQSNMPPTLVVPPDQLVGLGDEVRFEVTAVDIIDRDPVSLTAHNLPGWASFTVETNGTTLTGTFSGTHSAVDTFLVTFIAEDVDGAVEADVNISVEVLPDILLSERFDLEALPAGWSVIANAHTNGLWWFDDPNWQDNYTGGDGGMAIADSDWAGQVVMDAELRTPTLDLHEYPSVRLEFKTDFWYWAGGFDEIGDVDVSIGGAGGPWVNVWRKTNDHWGPVTEEVDISFIATRQTNVVLRFRYHNAYFDGYWAIDDVMVYGDTTGGPSNSPPLLICEDRWTTDAGMLVQFDLRSSDPVDGDTVSLNVVGLPKWATFTTWPEGEWTVGRFSGISVDPGATSVVFRAADKDGTTEKNTAIEVLLPRFAILSEHFESPPPDGWTVLANSHPDAQWRFDDPDELGNLTGSTGKTATADSRSAGEVDMDTELRAPALDIRGFTSTELSFHTSFSHYLEGSNEIADVDISTDGADGPWVNVWRKTEDYSNPAHEIVDISAISTGQPNVIIRFRYYDAHEDDYWQIDEVVVSGDEPYDSDGDGLPNWWERKYFDGPTNAVPSDDTDEDHMSNRREWLTGTDPRDPGSALRIIGISNAVPEGVDLRWWSVYGQQYSVWACDSLSSNFALRGSNLLPTPPANRFVDSTATNAPIRFYLIGTE